MGRKTKMTDETVRKLQEAIGVGASYKHAAEYAGIHYDTLREWMNTKPAFSASIHAREGAGAVTLMALMQKAAQEDWHAAAWKLEHRWPDEYARNRIEIEHSGEIDVSVLAQLRTVVTQAFPDDPSATERIADALSNVTALPPTPAVGSRKSRKAKVS